MYEVIFLIVLALVWIIFASIQDIKQREVADWLSLSLIIFALGFRFFYCLFENESFGFFYQGLIGLVIFFVLANLLYYGRMFAGGDAKLFMALGAILPFSENFFINLRIFLFFIVLFLFFGGIYGLIWSFVLSIRNSKKFKKEWGKQTALNKKIIYFGSIFGLLIMIFGFYFSENLFFYFGILIFITPYLFLFAKSVDESCMIKEISVKKLTEGDLLYKNVRFGKNLIRARWDGISRKEINLLKKHKKKIKIREGIPFVPVFLISFLILIYSWFLGLDLFLVLSNLF